MNILYILYNNFRSNSALHVHNFANSLIEKNHNCAVSVPDEKENAEKFMDGDILYKPFEFHEVNNAGFMFQDKSPPDIIHAWTPRDIVRKQYIECKKKFPSSRLIIHLEDNEAVILKKITGLPVFILKLLPEKILRRIVSDYMSHPRHYHNFLVMADGITMIMDTLKKFVSKKQPHIILWPIINPDYFSGIKKDTEIQKKLGILNNEVILAYTGNAHPSNSDEMRSLYMAVGLANKEGIPVRLIRTGIDICKFLSKNDEWVRKYVIELGFVDRNFLLSCLSLADILIQPGKPGKFNDYRLPSKIPEFLATDKPVVVPNTNIGRFLKNNIEAVILEKGDEREILSIIKKLREDKAFAGSIAESGRQFVLKHFNKERIAGKLEAFYRHILTL